MSAPLGAGLRLAQEWPTGSTNRADSCQHLFIQQSLHGLSIHSPHIANRPNAADVHALFRRFEFSSNGGFALGDSKGPSKVQHQVR
jgi:hypothetical protein